MPAVPELLANQSQLGTQSPRASKVHPALASFPEPGCLWFVGQPERIQFSWAQTNYCQESRKLTCLELNFRGPQILPEIFSVYFGRYDGPGGLSSLKGSVSRDLPPLGSSTVSEASGARPVRASS